jgi:hypothetical protein
MIKLVIAIAFAVFLFAVGCSSLEIAVALAIAFAFTYGAIGMHSVIQRRTQRKIAPRSERYDAAFFGIGLGIAMPAYYLLQDSHFLVVTTAVFAGFILAEIVAHAFFGEPITADDSE